MYSTTFPIYKSVRVLDAKVLGITVHSTVGRFHCIQYYCRQRNPEKRCKEKVKVKMSLRLIKYHIVKMYPILKDVWGSRLIAPRILNLGTRWR
jgi:hypothetical protein